MTDKIIYLLNQINVTGIANADKIVAIYKLLNTAKEEYDRLSEEYNKLKELFDNKSEAHEEQLEEYNRLRQEYEHLLQKMTAMEAEQQKN